MTYIAVVPEVTTPEVWLDALAELFAEAIQVASTTDLSAPDVLFYEQPLMEAVPQR